MLGNVLENREKRQMMVGQMKTLNTFLSRNLLNTKGTAECHGQYDVLIHDSYPDVQLFHSLLRGDFLHDGFNCCNGLWCYYSVCLIRSRRVCYRTNTIHELPSPLVHLL